MKSTGKQGIWPLSINYTQIQRLLLYGQRERGSVRDELMNMATMRPRMLSTPAMMTGMRARITDVGLTTLIEAMAEPALAVP